MCCCYVVPVTYNDADFSLHMSSYFYHATKCVIGLVLSIKTMLHAC